MSTKIYPIQTGLVQVKRSQRSRLPGGLLSVLLDSSWSEWLPIYAWAIDHTEGIFVVDSGETARATEPGYYPGWHPYYRSSVRMRVQPSEEIGPLLKEMGINMRDVRSLVLTHFHTDHAGGLHHFKNSEILVSGSDYRLARSFMGKLMGYLPQRWPDWFAPQSIAFDRHSLGSFPQSYALTKAGDIHIVPTPGHTPGHLSVVVKVEDVFYFLAGDTSYSQELLLARRADGVSPDPQVAVQTQERILALAGERPLVYLPTHDPDSGTRLSEQRLLVKYEVEREPVYA